MIKNIFSVLIADPQVYPGGISQFKYELNAFREAGIEAILGTCVTEDDIIQQGQKKDVILLAGNPPMGEKAFKNLPDCKAVLRYGVGVDSVDIDAAAKHGKLVLNMPDFCMEELATHASSLILGLCRKIVLHDRMLRNGKWDAMAGYPLKRLSNLTLGLFGFGRSGKWLAKIFHYGWRMKIIVFDPYVSKKEIQKLNVNLVEFEDLLRLSDIISIHAPLTKETYHIFGEREFQKMKSTSVIVNICRGSIIDESALLKALKEKWILGAGLDVFEKEPLSKNSHLLQFENIILTPHTAYYTEDSVMNQHKIAVEIVIQVLNGRIPCNNVVNKIP